MKTLARPNVGLKNLSVSMPSAAVSLSSVEYVEAQLDTSQAADAHRPRDAEVEQRLRRQPLRAARLDQHAPLTVLRVDAAPSPPTACRCSAADWRRPRAGAWHVDRGHDPEHVRTIVGQAAACVDEIVRIAPERDRRRRTRRVGRRPCRPARRGGRPAGGLQPVRPRERVRAKRLPAVRPAFLDRDDEAVVRQRVSVGIRQQIAASARSGWSRAEHRHRAAVGQRRRRRRHTRRRHPSIR